MTPWPPKAHVALGAAAAACGALCLFAGAWWTSAAMGLATFGQWRAWRAARGAPQDRLDRLEAPLSRWSVQRYDAPAAGAIVVLGLVMLLIAVVRVTVVGWDVFVTLLVLMGAFSIVTTELTGRSRRRPEQG